jgi:PAS domain S-box-containing protein
MERSLRILHLEDSAIDGELVALALAQAGLDADITRVGTRKDFIEVLRRGDFDLVLSDFSLPGFDGFSALSTFRERDAETPFIFVSGTIGEDRAVQALRQGATDYVLKDRLQRLPSALQRSLEEHRRRGAHRLADERIREQAALLDEAREAIVVKDVDRKVTYWNKGAETIYGWSSEEAISGAADSRFASQKDVEDAWQAVLKTGMWDGTFHQLTRDGREIIVDAHWTCLRHADGTPRAVLSIGSDVTQARSVEAQLQRSQRLETVGMVAGGVAHDLNNVLSPILMGIARLRKKVPDDSAQRLLDIMQVSVERGAAIVRQVLVFARGGGQSSSYDTKDAIRTVEKLVQAALPKSVEFTLQVPEDLRRLTGDATQLQQVLLNLCVNARDAMPEGGRLLVQASNVTLGGDREYVCIRVVDSGLGMPPDVQRKIFEPFFTTKAQGTGIGLATVASIVKRHGGFIELESEPSRGTEFRVFLPLAPTGPAAEPKAAPDISGGGRLLLVVEEGALLEIIKGTLEAYGYRVLCAENDQQALDLHQQRQGEIAAVLTNLSIPGLDGVGMIRRLAQQDPRVKVINTSGLPDLLPVAGVESIVRATLTKPYSAEKLLEVVRQVLEMA